jgi:cytochrome c biogenesis factor
MIFDIIGTIGRLAIILGFITTIFASIAYFRSLKHEGLIPFARTGFHITTSMVFVAVAALIILILKHQYQFHYVWAYSSNDLPFGLLLSTFYAGQEGSFMLWTLMVSIMGIVLMSYTQRHENEREVMGIYTTILSFLLLLLVAKNPFAPLEAAQIPLDGKGLNPLLQNFWMQIHPPILFLGFASMTPPFALAIAALMQNKFQNWIVSSLPWVVRGAMILGLGISLGGFWAYETLGWGGWWGWDPVENSSLIPWLISVALVHTMLTQKRTHGLIMTNFILAILSFVLVLYSTFLTRSGVLGDASVHSFVDPGRFAFTLLVLFMFVFSDVGMALLFSRFTKWGMKLYEQYSGWKLITILYCIAIVPSIPIFAKIAGDLVPVFNEIILTSPSFLGVVLYPLLGISYVLNALSFLWIPAIAVKLAFMVYTLTGRLHSEKEFRSFNILSRETFLGFGAVILGLLTIVVLLGTSLPVFPKSIVAGINSVLHWINNLAGSDLKLGNTVEPSFYNALGLPIGMLLTALAASALLLKWKQNTPTDFFKKLLLPLGISFVITLLLVIIAGVNNLGMILLCFFSLFSLAVNIQIGWPVVKGNRRFTGAYIAHIGIACILLGIVGSGFYGTKKVMELPMGTPKEAFGYFFTFSGVEPFHNGERYHFNVKVADKDNKEIETIQTVMFVSMYGGQEQVMRNPGIAKSLVRDIYIEPQAVTQPDQEGGEKMQFTKGKMLEFNGYRVTFITFEMNPGQGDQNFTIGGKFTVMKPGQDPEDLEATRVSGPDGVVANPVLTKDGNLELVILGIDPNRENLSKSIMEVRLRDPHAQIDTSKMVETLSAEISIKPFISFVWAGILLMVFGFGIASVRRTKDARKLELNPIAPTPLPESSPAPDPATSTETASDIDRAPLSSMPEDNKTE